VWTSAPRGSWWKRRDRRHDMIAAGQWLHSFYQSDEGLERPRDSGSRSTRISRAWAPG
jgi:hypothetical protein